MKKIFKIKPKEGWEKFRRHQELTDLIWENLNDKKINYYNFTSDTSIWDDGESNIFLHYKENQITEFTFTESESKKETSLLFKSLVEKLQQTFNLDLNQI